MWSHPALAAVAHFVSAQTGLSFESARRADAEAGIRRAMARAGIVDLSRYLQLLEAGRMPLDDLVTELTVGETYFFREAAHFEFIQTEIFRDVLDRRGADHVLRIWSAGCATGEEPYSLAIVLEDAGLRGQVLATDISRAALQRAREATYRPWSLRGLDEVRIQRVFHRADDRWRLDPRFGNSVTFQFHNLAQDAYPSLPAGIWGMDLIVCRNVLIYFDQASIRRVAQGLHESLAEGGWLITGPSDPPLDAAAPLVPIVTKSGVFYRKGHGTRRVAVPVVEARPRMSIAELPRNEPWGPLHAPSTPAAQASADAPAVPSNPADSDLGRRGGPLMRTANPVLAGRVAERPDLGEGDPLADAREALAAGDYERALTLTQAGDPPAAVLHLRALANARGAEDAVQYAQRVIRRHPLSIELHLLHALLLLDVKRHADAGQALRRVLYLDRSLAIASHLLGAALRDQGKVEAARRAYRNARDLARARPPDEELRLADGERAAALAAIAEAELALLETKEKAS